MIQAVIYARFSSHKQREESIEGQVRVCKEYAASKNMNVVGMYADRAISGRTDDRPDFQRMIADSKRKLFQVILVWKGDRIARNRQDKAHYRQELKKNGVIIKSVTEAIPNTPEGIILESVLDGMDEYYSASLAINTKRGMRENALAAKHNGGAVPFGFLLDDDKRYIEDPDKAPLVAEMFDLFAKGAMLSEIQRSLSERAIKRPSGKDFTINAVRSLLQNRKYTGLYMYDDVIIKGGCPQLITEEIFEMAQKRFKDYSQKRSSATPVNFRLTGKLVCGKCQETMAGDSGTSRTGEKHYYYTCNGKKNHKSCDLPTYRKEDLEAFVERVASLVIQDDRLVNDIADAVIRYQDGRPAAAKLAALAKRIKVIDSQLDKAANFILTGGDSPTVRQKLAELEEERKRIEEEMLEVNVENRTVSKEQIVFWINHFRVGEQSDEDFNDLLIQTFVNSVIVNEDKIAVVFNYTDEQKDKVTFINENDLIPLASEFESASDGSPCWT